MRLIMLKHSLTRYVDNPASVRNAARVIMVATLSSVLLGGVLMRIFEPDEYPDLGVSMWWAIQTVTTVGYGDVTPKSPLGRFVGSLIMLQSIAFVTVVTATITSSFVERMRQQQNTQQATDAVNREQRLHAHFDELAARLERIESSMVQPGDQSQPEPPRGG